MAQSHGLRHPGAGPVRLAHSERNPQRITDPFAFDRSFLGAVDSADHDLRLAGADEAGRGSLAGPIVAAAVVLDYADAPFDDLRGLTDSKLLKSSLRETLYRSILGSAKKVSLVAVSARTLDRVGLHRSNIEALAGALEACRGHYVHALVDGFDIKRPELGARALVRGDYKSAVIGAASVVAKVARDRLMRAVSPAYPDYGFEVHVGYGTKTHREALRTHGPCGLHRMSFQQVGITQLWLWEDRPGVEPPT